MYETSYQIRNRGYSLREDWLKAQDARKGLVNHRDHNQGQSSLISWVAPPPGYLKTNVDAAFPTDVSVTGLGMCLMGEQGNILWARTSWVQPQFFFGSIWISS